MNTRFVNNKPNQFEQKISPKPISACDLLKVMLEGESEYTQEKPYPPIEIGRSVIDEKFPLYARTKDACDFNMVIDPMSLNVGSSRHTLFFSKEKHEKSYKEASKHCDYRETTFGMGCFDRDPIIR